MASKKRKTAKPRVATEATKAKLPKPKRKRSPGSAPKIADWPCGVDPSLGADLGRKRKRKPTLMEATDENLRESLRLSERLATPRAIPCGEDVSEALASGATITMFGGGASGGSGGIASHTTSSVPFVVLYDWACEPIRVPPPDTSAYPWPLKAAWKLDGWLAKIAKRFA